MLVRVRPRVAIFQHFGDFAQTWLPVRLGILEFEVQVSVGVDVERVVLLFEGWVRHDGCCRGAIELEAASIVCPVELVVLAHGLLHL